MVAVSKFAEWLENQMRLSGFDDNQSKLATYMGTGSSTVNAWFTRGATPSPELCRRLANALRVPLNDVLAAAGHPVYSEPDGDEIPGWLRSMLPLLEQLDASEAAVLEGTAQGLLAMREHRARYEAQERDPLEAEQ